MHCEHKCHPHKLTEANSLRQQVQPRLSRRQKSSISEYQKTLIHCAKEWALEDYHTHCYNDSILFKKAEYGATKTVALKTKGWAMKKAPPAVHFPERIRQELLILFNQKDPYVQPEEALAHLRAMPEFRNDVFVEYCVTAARIKAYFGSLLTKKKKTL